MNDHTATGFNKMGQCADWHPRLKSQFRLQWEPTQDAHVLLYPEGMIKLNPSAANILQRCDGTRDIATLVTDLERAFNAIGLSSDVQVFVDHALARGWLERAP
jgi:pyrroloquinoline quinone biosynthesis protein D